ncbi:GLPGLI family protein [Porphyromonadaceae bacterium W3.11]|nr:GLPGLI family protein [Porphyromonadaceae bacterium W3.11]
MMRRILSINLLAIIIASNMLFAQESTNQIDSLKGLSIVYGVQQPVMLENNIILEKDTIQLTSTGTKSIWKAWDKERRSHQEVERQKAVHRRLSDRIAVFYSTINELRISMREKGEELNMENFHSWDPTMMTEVMITDNLSKQSKVYAVEQNVAIVASLPLPELDWIITSDTATIQGMLCEKAQVNWNGRDWEAWFTRSIPLVDGPSTFKGLPGLIVKVQDSEELYKYELLGLKEEWVPASLFEVPKVEKTMEISEKQLNEYMAGKLMYRMGYTIGADGTVYYIKNPMLYRLLQ